MAPKRYKKRAFAPMLLIVMGALLMPGGFVLSNVIQGVVASEIDTALLAIEDQGVPLVSDMVKEMGTPEALRGIRDQGVPTVKDLVLQTGGAEVLDQIRETAIPIVVEMVKQIGSAEVLNQINSTAIPIVVEMVKQIGTAEVLNRINSTAIPIVEDMVMQIGPAEVLNQIRDNAIPIVVEMVKQLGVAEVLNRIRDTAMPIVEEMVNNTFTAYLLQTMLDGLEMEYLYESLSITLDVTADAATPTQIFNTASYYLDTNAVGWSGLIQVDVFDVYGLAKWLGTDQSYSTTALNRFFYGNNTGNPDSPYYIPGLVQDIDSGSGVGDFLELYDAAVATPSLQSALINKYQCTTWTQIENVANYLRNYLEAQIIPKVIAGVSPTVEVIGIGFMKVDIDLLATLKPTLAGMTSTDEIAEAIFKELWANGTAMGAQIYENGIDFSDMVDGVADNATNFEVAIFNNGVVTPSGITRTQVTDLWDEADPHSFFNMDEGVALWHDAYTNTSTGTTLRTHFGLTTTQMTMLLNWLWQGPFCFSEWLVPILINSPEGYSMTIDAYSEVLFQEQWANGTIRGDLMYPGGLNFGEMMPGVGIPDPTRGFEVCTYSGNNPNPTDITGDICAMLWDEEDDKSLFNMDGMQKWYDANTNSTTNDTLKAYFTLTDAQMSRILAWLWEGSTSFSQHMVPTLIESEAGYSMTVAELSQILFMGLWANGTALGKVMYPGGMDFGQLMTGAGIPIGTRGFEVCTWDMNGQPTATGISADVCENLWNEANELSLFNMDGISVWFKAISSEGNQTLLLSAFPGLSHTQMHRILTWLWDGPNSFSQKMVPILINSSAGYSMTIDAYSQELFMEQWANGTIRNDLMYPGGLNFGEMMLNMDIPDPTRGFEVCTYQPDGITPIPTEITVDVCKQLWNASNSLSLFHMDNGIKVWYNASIDPGTRSLLLSAFPGLTGTQMDRVLTWLWGGANSFSQKMVPTLINSKAGYGMTIETYSEQLFMEQWANGTIRGDLMYPGGLNFFDMMPGMNIPAGTRGFEVCTYEIDGITPIPTGITVDTCTDLWDGSNPLSLFNMDGMAVWYAANSSLGNRTLLMDEFTDLTDPQMDRILAWLWGGEHCFSLDLLVTLIASDAGYGMELDEFAFSLLLEQWTNGTILGNVRYVGGIDFSDIMVGLPSLQGFEVATYTGSGIPIPSGITYASAKDLFNDTIELSLTNNSGINTWIKAQVDASKRTLLANTFRLTIGQVNQILEWAFVRSFKDDVVPALMELPVASGGRGTTLANLSRNILLETWVNATADGRHLYPKGFPLPLGELTIYGFEIGFVDVNTDVKPTNISLDSAMKLWDVTTTTSLTTNEGLAKWWIAQGDTSSPEYGELKTAIGLNDAQMEMVLLWMVNFRDDAMPYLAQYQLGLPTDTTTLCNILAVGGLVMGIGSFVLGSVSLKRRRTANRMRALDIAKFETAGKKTNLQKSYISKPGAISAPTSSTSPAQAPVVGKKASPFASAVAQPAPAIAPLTVKAAESKPGLTEAEQAKIRDAARAKISQLATLPSAPSATKAIPQVSALPTVATLASQQKLTPAEEEFFQKVTSGIKQVMVKIAKKESVDPLFISNLLYLLRTRRKNFEQQGNIDAIKRIDEMFTQVEQLQRQGKAQQK